MKIRSEDSGATKDKAGPSNPQDGSMTAKPVTSKPQKIPTTPMRKPKQPRATPSQLVDVPIQFAAGPSDGPSDRAQFNTPSKKKGQNKKEAQCKKPTLKQNMNSQN